MAARTLTAAIGGYLLAALTSALLPYVLPLRRDEGVEAATLASFAVYANVVVVVFAARSACRVSAWLLLAIALLAAALVLAVHYQGRL